MPSASNGDTQPLDVTCPDCQGEGWYIGHENQCYAKGDCECSGVQEWCDRCQGTGRLDSLLPYDTTGPSTWETVMPHGSL